MLEQRDQLAGDPLRLSLDLDRRKAGGPPALEERRTIARAVRCERSSRAVKRPPIDFHDQAVSRPAKVNFSRAVVAIDLWPRNAMVDADLQHRGLAIAARPCPPVVFHVSEEREQRRRPGTSGSCRQRRLDRPEVEELEPLGLLDGASQLM